MRTVVQPSPSASTEAKRALLAERLRKAAGQPATAPLSFAQQRLWFLDQLEPGCPLYNIPTVARLTGTLDFQALERTLQLSSRGTRACAPGLCPSRETRCKWISRPQSEGALAGFDRYAGARTSR